MSDRDDIGTDELRERVLYALLEPAARAARLFGAPLADVRDLAEMAYYHETRRRNLKMKTVAELMDVSMSKVALLSRALKENFLRADNEAALPRRIEFMLWAEPLTLAKIKQVLTDAEPTAVNDAIRELLDDGRIRKERSGSHTVYALEVAADRRGWDNWLRRVDGLQNALRNVTDAAIARFALPPDETSFARTLSFRARRSDIARLQDLYEQLFALVVEIDQHADDKDADDIVSLTLSMFWAPYDLADRADLTEDS